MRISHVSRTSAKSSSLVLKVAVATALVAIWHLLSLNATVNFFISSPWDTVQYAGANAEGLVTALGVTLVEATCGLIVAVTASFGFAVLCTLRPFLLRPARAGFVVTQVLPIITLAPFFIAVLGMGVLSKVAMVAIMCFFPVFMNLMKGIEQTRAMADGFLSLYAAPMRIRLVRIYLPLALPSAFVGIKIATTMAVLGAIVAEFLGAYYGLGKNLYSAPKNANAELMMVSAILTAAMGAAIFRIAELMEQRLTGWE